MDLYSIRNELNSGKTIFDIPMNVTFYARVSTDKDAQQHSLSAQIGYYSDFIKANPNWVFVEGYIDEGLSGTSVKKRESFLRMIDDAKHKKFDFIITKEISRFSRNTLDSIKYTQKLLSFGVGILFQSDNINTLYPDAELRLTIMSSIAQDEVRKISERVKFGFRRAIDNGVVLGNNEMWGYDKDNGKLKINEEEAEIVRTIFDIYVNEKFGMRRLCEKLTQMGYLNRRGNPFSFSTIRGILTNPKYKGYYCGGKTHKYDYKLEDRKYIDESEWIMYKDEDNVPPIVSEEIWDKANRILNSRSEKMSSEDKTSYQNKYTYSGKIICAKHNTPYYRTVFKYKSGDKEAWNCKEYTEKGRSGCTSPVIYTSEIDIIMKQILRSVIVNKSDIIHDMIKMYGDLSQSSNISENVQKANVKINNILKMKDKLLDLSIKERINDDEFEIRNDKFSYEIKILEKEIDDLSKQQQKNNDFSDTISSLKKLISNELLFDNEIDPDIVNSVLDKIEVHESTKKNEVELKIYLKLIEESSRYSIKRTRGKTSVCTPLYI